MIHPGGAGSCTHMSPHEHVSCAQPEARSRAGIGEVLQTSDTQPRNLLPLKQTVDRVVQETKQPDIWT